MQFLVIGRDGRDPGAPQRRQAARAAHLELGRHLAAAGRHLYAVAMLSEDGQMTGSVIVADYPDRAALEAWLLEEPYMKGGVWEQLEITPCRPGPAFQAARD